MAETRLSGTPLADTSLPGKRLLRARLPGTRPSGRRSGQRLPGFRLPARILLAATAVVATALTPVAAHAQPTKAAPASRAGAPAAVSIMHLTLDAGPRLEQHRTVILRCHPSGGTHPSSGQACTALSEAGGDFTELRAGNANRICPLVYRPVTVTATGAYDNFPVRYTETFPNPCVLGAYTGPVFDF